MGGTWLYYGFLHILVQITIPVLLHFSAILETVPCASSPVAPEQDSMSDILSLAQPSIPEEKGADILDLCVDGLANDGSNRSSKAVFSKPLGRFRLHPQLPSKIHQVPSNEDHKALPRGTLGGAGT